MCLILVFLLLIMSVNFSVECNLEDCDGYQNQTACSCMLMEVMNCSSCLPERRLMELEYDFCLCTNYAVRQQQLVVDLCYRYRQGSFQCPSSKDPKLAVYFDDETCECKIEPSTPCGTFVEPCLPPFSWYRGDNITNCICTAPFNCSVCQTANIVEDLGNGTCLCDDLQPGGYYDFYPTNPSVDYCDLYNRHFFKCPTFQNPLVISVFNSVTCTCEIIESEPCSKTAPPCLPPYFWFNDDDKIFCACVMKKPCNECETDSILKYVGEGMCQCQRNESEELTAMTAVGGCSSAKGQNCLDYYAGKFLCPFFESMSIISYFNESTCECEALVADPCWLRETRCNFPHYWYNNDDTLLCLCVQNISCEDCLEDRVVENYGNGTCVCHYVPLFDDEKPLSIDYSYDYKL